jgi:dTDP-4-amino-4,6-dideoxygalactose transaminase
MIEYLIPDMPTVQEVTPWLTEIDQNRWYSNFGPLEERFRDQLASDIFSDLTKENIATCSSGTVAIALSLKALGLTKGAKVLLPAFTFPGTVAAVLSIGCEPVLCDVDNSGWQLDPTLLDQYFNSMKISAVIPVAAFGAVVDVSVWDKVSKKYSVPVIVDAAAALGQQNTGNLVLCFSLHATKLLGIGEGGLVVAKDQELIKRVVQLSNFGFEKGEISLVGMNAKLSEYHAAIGLAQLTRKSCLFVKRQKIYNICLNNLSDILKNSSCRIQDVGPQTVPSSFVVRLPYASAKSIWDYLRTKGIETRQLYCPSLHDHSALKSECVYFKDRLPVSIDLACSTLALPYHNFLTENEIKGVCDHLNQALHQFHSSQAAVS